MSDGACCHYCRCYECRCARYDGGKLVIPEGFSGTEWNAMPESAQRAALAMDRVWQLRVKSHWDLAVLRTKELNEALKAKGRRR